MPVVAVVAMHIVAQLMPQKLHRDVRYLMPAVAVPIFTKPATKMKRISLKTFAIASLIALLGLVSYYLYKQSGVSIKNKISKPAEQAPANIVSNSENKNSILYKLPSGDQEYSVSHGQSTTGPKMTKILFSPLSFKTTEKQKITLFFPKSEIVSSGVLFLTTDNIENKKVNLNKDNSTQNTWSVELLSDDTINTRYNIRIYLVGPSGTYDTTMYFL